MKNELHKRTMILAAALLAGAAMIGTVACTEKTNAASAPQLQDVEVAVVQQRDIPIEREWIGTLDGMVNADIKAQATGYLMRQNYAEGSFVHQGQLLFEIDARPLQAAEDQAEGQLAQAKAQLLQANAGLLQARAQLTSAEANQHKAQLDEDRYIPLAKQQAITQQDLDNASQSNQSQKAQVAAAKAQIETAQAQIEAAKAAVTASAAAVETTKVNLGFTKLVSPIDGIAGKATTQVGNLVSPSSNAVTTVSTLDPIKANFTVSEQEYLSLTRSASSINHLELELILADGTVHPHKGRFSFADRQVDASTGAIQLTGLFPNPGNKLRPGLYGKVRASVGMRTGALLVPQRAVNEMQGSYSVAVVDHNNTIRFAVVKPGDRIGSDWIVDEGLKPGERVVTDGLFKIRPGAPVNPKRGKIMSKFFINRPIVAMVIALLMVIIGAVTIAQLPISQFPAIAPPEVQIHANYVGADAQTIEQSVATPIEQQMSGVDNLNYMYSLNAAGNGQMTMIVNFDEKSDPNTDLMLTQMRETQAASQLPQDVTNYGVTVQKSVTAPLMVLGLFSPNGTYDGKFLANYSYINLNDQLTRVPGIGNVQVFGAGQYAMRLWIKPDQLAKLGITVTEVVSAIQAQNTVNPAGQVGGMPAPKGQEYTYSVRAQGRLTSPEEFGNIIVRELPDGGTVRVRDVARIELGSQDYTLSGRINGKPGAIIAVYQLPGTNAVDAAKGVRKLMQDAKRRFPQDVDYVVALDTTESVTEGIRDIVVTIAIAILLVTIVVYLFLQGWRATLIPLLAVPVSLIGTFMLFPVFGFSINTLSLFGIVLAIGLVVDDAIVVVEAVERHMEEGMSPKQAALKAMEEISGPVIGIALVLSAVFVPTIFIPGITGRLYQQFAVTIAISVILSAFNALTLSPALAALLLKPKTESHGLQRRFFNWFNRTFERATNGYIRWSGALIRKSAVALVVLVVAGAGAAFISSKVPSGFLPGEDQGYMYMHLQLPNASSLERTEAAAAKVEEILLKTPGVKYTTRVAGFSLLSFVSTSYTGLFFVTLDDWKDRTSRQTQYQEIVQHVNQELAKLPDGFALTFPPPAIPGVGTSGGFTFVLEDRAGKDVQFLSDNLQKFMAAAAKRPEIAPGMVSTFLPSVPQQYLAVDREKALKQGVPLSDVYRTIQAYMGGLFVNYFNSFGRQWQVYVEAEGEYRKNLDSVGQFYVRNTKGEMVPLSSLVKFESRPGPEFTMRYNLYRSAQIIGGAAPGYSSAQAMKALEETFEQTMPREMGYDYMGMSYQEKKAQQGVPTWMIFAFSLLFVFLILAALYESWTLPFSVLLSTPVALFGAFAVLWLRRWVAGLFFPAYMVQIENDVYSQIGLVMLIGLAAKNAILIVEFAKDKFEQGMGLAEAALEGARLRLRPILMTSFAFILGCVPLWTASGAGSVGRQIMGTTVIGGMLAASAIGIFLIPAIFYVVEKLSGAKVVSRNLAPSAAHGDSA